MGMILKINILFLPTYVFSIRKILVLIISMEITQAAAMVADMRMMTDIMATMGLLTHSVKEYRRT